jgi:hypothetical protein
MAHFREFLTENEIFFKTAAATLLSLMALIVSIGQFVTARQRKTFLELQARIAEANVLPQFEVAIHQQLNEATGTYDNNNLIIRNDAGPVHQFNAEAAVFIHVNAIRGTPVSSTTFDLPVNSYFGSQFPSTAGKGQLTSVSGYRNNAMFIALERSTREAAHGQDWDSFNIEPLVYVHLVTTHPSAAV